MTFFKDPVYKAMAAIMIILAVSACQASDPSKQGTKNEGDGRKDVRAAQSNSASEIAKPPIDLAVPAKTETATFALG